MTDPRLSSTGFRPLGQILLEEGAVSPEGLAQALEYRVRKGLKLGQALVDLRLVDEAALAHALKEQGRLYCIELSPAIVDPRVAQELEEGFARARRCIAINRIAGVTTVAMEDPADASGVDEIATRLGTQVLAVYADPERIDECIRLAYGVRFEEEDELANVLAAFPEEELRFFAAPEDPESITEVEGVDGPVINLVHALLKDAIEARASAVHFEPRDRRFVVRFRIDGALHDRLTLEKGWARPCIARIKLMCGMDVAWRELPQTGGTRTHFRGEEVHWRASTAPTAQGEAAVLSISTASGVPRRLEELGLGPERVEFLRGVLAGRGGLVLAAGPLASGRRTTLHALLAELHPERHKLVAIDPRARPVAEGVAQLVLDAEGGFSCAEALRAALAQDADAILVGEIADGETAALAARAAVEGRLVLAVTCASDGARALARWLELGADPSLLADGLRAVLAQRLVRRPCPACRRAERPDPELLLRFGLAQEVGGFARGAGCGECHFSGFRGRVALFELAGTNAALRSALHRRSDAVELRRAMIESGLTSLREEGLRRALEGDTSLHEVLAATSEEDAR